MTELIIRYAEPSGIADKTVIPSEVVGELVRCKDCEYLDIWNTKFTYAMCNKHGIVFKPFEEDTRTHYCSWAKMKGGK